ncbi:MAG TPA: lysophospholipid acyltransferase family protein [Candidatus Acidoferrales bacterium]|nr:lysophospholipid acyltransferase family protein [Candidatus Acidoferrales bacterium]
MLTEIENPFRVSAFMHGLAKLLFRLTGWKIEGGVPSPPRCVIIAAPHTSNWDAFVLVTAAYIFRVKLSWFVKDAAFFWPLGPIVRYFGGVPIDRLTRRNMVQQAIDQFAARDNFLLAVPPEGTRKHSTHWKSGFYHIARGAGVPIVLGYVDYKRKVAGLGPCFIPTDDLDADFKVFVEFYSHVTPKYPADKGIVAPRPPEPET